MTKIVQIERRYMEADAGDKFSLIDLNGMRWYGVCRAIDHGPNDFYAITGTVTAGPAEWVGLEVVIHGIYDGSTLDVEPAALYNKRVAQPQFPQRPGGRMVQESIHAETGWAPE